MSRWLERLQTLEAEPDEDEGMVAPMAEHAHPTHLTKPTKAPAGSVVRALECPAVENAPAAAPPTPYWSDVVQERFWVAPTATQAAALAAQGQVVYQPDEIWRLGYG